MNEQEIKADELREKLRKERVTSGRQRNIDISRDSSNSDNATQGRTPGGSTITEPAESAENGLGDSSRRPVQHPLSTVSGRTDSNQGHDSTVTDSQRKLAGSSGSSTQNNRRTGQSIGRSSQDNATNRSDGIDLRESVSSSQPAIAPIVVGNLIRNVEEESRTYVPPRTFAQETPTVGQPALIVTKDGTLGKRTTKSKSSNATRAVETLKAVIPKAKRGRPPGKSNPQNVFDEIPSEPTRLTLKDKIKEAGQAIPTGKRLDAKEVDELREPLQAALTDEFDQLDKLLWLYEGADSIQQPIWSDINDHEMEKLVNALLNMGTRSATVATVARASVDLSDYIIAGTLLAPRLQSTAKLVGDVRKRKKQSRGRNR